MLVADLERLLDQPEEKPSFETAVFESLLEMKSLLKSCLDRLGKLELAQANMRVSIEALREEQSILRSDVSILARVYRASTEGRMVTEEAGAPAEKARATRNLVPCLSVCYVRLIFRKMNPQGVFEFDHEKVALLAEAFFATNQFERKSCRSVVVGEDPSALKMMDLDSLCLLLEDEAMDSMRRFLKQLRECMLSKMRYFISKEIFQSLMQCDIDFKSRAFVVRPLKVMYRNVGVVARLEWSSGIKRAIKEFPWKQCMLRQEMNAEPLCAAILHNMVNADGSYTPNLALDGTVLNSTSAKLRASLGLKQLPHMKAAAAATADARESSSDANSFSGDLQPGEFQGLPSAKLPAKSCFDNLRRKSK